MEFIDVADTRSSKFPTENKHGTQLALIHVLLQGLKITQTHVSLQWSSFLKLEMIPSWQLQLEEFRAFDLEAFARDAPRTNVRLLGYMQLRSWPTRP